MNSDDDAKFDFEEDRTRVLICLIRQSITRDLR
jgi:hypothetical protein